MAGDFGYDTGPFVNVACFCERVLQEKDEVLTITRVISKIDVQAQGPNAPDTLPELTLNTTLVVVLSAGAAKGSQHIQVKMEHPDGSIHSGQDFALTFPGGPEGTANMIMPMNFQAKSAGLYWATVEVNDRPVAKVPLQVTYGFTR